MSKKTMMTPDNKQVDELSEDMIMVGPGQMLSEARKKLSMSVDDVAEKLKFKQGLVNEIEADDFDQKLPATFNRGYLRSYAKLVNVDIDEVISAYDMLGIAEVQRSEMQSFSNLTEKQAEHSRLMWFSYLIVAILFGLMVLWWLQTSETTIPEKIKSVIEQPIAKSEQSVADTVKAKKNNDEKNQPEITLTNKTIQVPVEVTTDSAIVPEADELTTHAIEQVSIDEKPLTLVNEAAQELELSVAIFTFSGDCWVNIYDDTGERIAWGVKKSGYVMTVSGKPPLKVTLGKPELASIVFDGQAIDMSPFNVGNIAKFTLPIAAL